MGSVAPAGNKPNQPAPGRPRLTQKGLPSDCSPQAWHRSGQLESREDCPSERSALPAGSALPARCPRVARGSEAAAGARAGCGASSLAHLCAAPPDATCIFSAAGDAPPQCNLRAPNPASTPNQICRSLSHSHPTRECLEYGAVAGLSEQGNNPDP